MPIVFGENVQGVAQSVDACKKYGDRIRATYRARHVWSEASRDPYAGTTLERPPSLNENPAGILFPWEQMYVAAATCAGSDYPMLAAFFGVPIQRVELVVEGVFDPRGEFGGLDGLEMPPDAHCFLSLHVRATITSRASRAALEQIHERVVKRNMVLDALRGVPLTHELVIEGGAS
jgi:hypothetical protein